MDPLFKQFVPEARDLLDASSHALLELETDPANAAAVDSLFRSVHTLKGTAGLFDIPPFIRLVHAAEDLLDAVRGQKLDLDSALVDDLLNGMDCLIEWMDVLEDQQRLPQGAADRAAEFVSLYRGRLDCGELESGEAAEREAAPNGPRPAWLSALLSTAIEAERRVSGTDRLVAFHYRPAPDCFFSGEDPLHLVRQVPGLAHLDIAPATDWPVLSELDMFQCNLVLTGLTTGPIEEIEHLFRYVAEQVELHSFALDDEVARPDAEIASEGFSAKARDIVRAQIDILTRDARSPSWQSRMPAAVTTLFNVARAEGMALDLDRTSVIEQAVVSRDVGDLLACFREVGEAERSDPETGEPVKAKSASSEAVLKVEQSRVDALMDLAGELVVAKNALPFLARRAEQEFGSRAFAREIKSQYAALDRIAQDFQSAVMAVRMMPVGTLFARYPRLVRDTSRKLGKTIRLVIEGRETEADKNVIEALSDPLLHLVRNALDHGLETREERVGAGKPAEGEIRICARQDGDQVCIEVSDDGRGIDVTTVRRKAVEKALIGAEEAEALDDHQAAQLIFMPGFSTKTETSELSGRGVGMDVVKSSVEWVAGSVSLSTKPGEGTCVEIRLPLSMAVTSVMMVDADGTHFGVPMDHVVETVQLPRDEIRRFKTSEAFMLRDAIVPLVRLRDVLAMPGAEDERALETVLVCRLHGAPVGLVVDRFRVTMDVVLKPMHGVLEGVPGYAGTAVLGDGKILLVLNLKEIL
jgi:two-component system chemotaxis sensor kinase CheA